MQCIPAVHLLLVSLMTIQRATCFRSEQADERLRGNDVLILDEGNTNSVIEQHQFRRSLPETDKEVEFTPNLMVENIMKDNLMAVATPAKYREKRSKHSKGDVVKSSKRSEVVKTKDELMNILGAIRNAKHHKLSRKDIRELAKKAFARIKKKKTTEKSKIESSGDKKKVTKEVAKAPQIMSRQKAQSESDEGKGKHSKEKSSAATSTEASKVAKEDEKVFSNIFDDGSKPKTSEFAEDISKLSDTAKISQILTDDTMTGKKNDFEANLESLVSKKSSTSMQNKVPAAKKASQAIEQEISKALDSKNTQNTEKKDSNDKKSSIPDLGREEKVNTLRNLLSKANKNKVPKKFLQQFPAGLRMIAWRELLDKKKKELAELEDLQASNKKKSKSTDDKPVTVNIDIDQNLSQGGGIEGKQNSRKDGDKHQIASHVKFLQKHLSSAQDLRKLISRALIGHCKATGKRILKAFIAMDKALARAQTIATVIGKKFKVDSSKIENIVINKEDEVVESFLRDIFSNFTPK